MNKKLIRLTEQDLHRIVKESVNRMLKEEFGESMEVASMLKDKMQDILVQSGLEYDYHQDGFNVYPNDNDVVTIKIYKEGNIPYSKR